jgi:hypothetical protein
VSDPLHFAVEHAGPGGDLEHEGLLRRVSFGEVLHDAAQTVAAHLSDRAIGVVDHHAARDARLRENRQHAVSPDAEVAIAESARQIGIDVDAAFTPVDDHEVVPEALVFEEGFQTPERLTEDARCCDKFGLE